MIQSVLIEVRPQIRVCNIYIIFQRLSKIPNISINNNIINLEYYEKNGGPKISKSITIEDDDLNLVPKTMSLSQCNPKSIIIRIQTEPVIGSLSLEVLPFKDLNIRTNLNDEGSIPPFSSGQKCDLKCLCCGQSVLKKGQIFNRVLPLPQNGSLELSDWFCHVHCDHEETSASASSTEPRNHDCLFGNVWFMIREDKLDSCSIRRKEPSRVLNCSRCLAWLGVVSGRSLEIAKLWHSSVTTETEIPSRKNQGLIDFQKAIQEGIADSLGSVCKLNLYYTSNTNQSHFLLIWVIDRKLQVFFKISEPFQLKAKNVQKLLYSYQSKESDSLVQLWAKDFSVQNIEISKPMFIAGLQHLLHLTQFLPKPYDKIDHFNVACLGLNEF